MLGIKSFNHTNILRITLNTSAHEYSSRILSWIDRAKYISLYSNFYVKHSDLQQADIINQLKR